MRSKTDTRPRRDSVVRLFGFLQGNTYSLLIGLIFRSLSIFSHQTIFRSVPNFYNQFQSVVWHSKDGKANLSCAIQLLAKELCCRPYTIDNMREQDEGYLDYRLWKLVVASGSDLFQQDLESLAQLAAYRTATYV